MATGRLMGCLCLIGALLTGCTGAFDSVAQPTISVGPAVTTASPADMVVSPAPAQWSSPRPTATALKTEPPLPTVTPTPVPLVPHFSHIVFILLENEEISSVIGNPQMPNFNRLANEYTLLRQHYAIRHPSLPNYIALVGGDTFGIEVNFNNVPIDAVSLPDLIEKSGKTWKTYQESMPQNCGLEDTLSYVIKHNPFVHFASIRNDPERCAKHVVPLTQLDQDLAAGTLPNYIFITPNICHSAHDAYKNPACGLRQADDWLGGIVGKLLMDQQISKDGLIILTWDEGQGDHTCCNLPTGGGRIATVLVSPLAKKGFVDDTPYTHYSLLKLVSEAWGLEQLGHAADSDTMLPTAPWQ